MAGLRIIVSLALCCSLLFNGEVLADWGQPTAIHPASGNGYALFGGHYTIKEYLNGQYITVVDGNDDLVTDFDVVMAVITYHALLENSLIDVTDNTAFKNRWIHEEDGEGNLKRTCADNYANLLTENTIEETTKLRTSITGKKRAFGLITPVITTSASVGTAFVSAAVLSTPIGWAVGGAIIASLTIGGATYAFDWISEEADLNADMIGDTFSGDEYRSFLGANEYLRRYGDGIDDNKIYTNMQVLSGKHQNAADSIAFAAKVVTYLKASRPIISAIFKSNPVTAIPGLISFVTSFIMSPFNSRFDMAKELANVMLWTAYSQKYHNLILYKATTHISETYKLIDRHKNSADAQFILLEELEKLLQALTFFYSNVAEYDMSLNIREAQLKYLKAKADKKEYDFDMSYDNILNYLDNDLVENSAQMLQGWQDAYSAVEQSLTDDLAAVKRAYQELGVTDFYSSDEEVGIDWSQTDINAVPYTGSSNSTISLGNPSTGTMYNVNIQILDTDGLNVTPLSSPQDIPAGANRNFEFQISPGAGGEHRKIKANITWNNGAKQRTKHILVPINAAIPTGVVYIKANKVFYEPGEDVTLEFYLNAVKNETITLKTKIYDYDVLVKTLSDQNLNLTAGAGNKVTLQTSLPQDAKAGFYSVHNEVVLSISDIITFKTPRIFCVVPGQVSGDLNGIDFTKLTILTESSDEDISQRISNTLDGAQIRYYTDPQTGRKLTAGELLQEQRTNNLVLVGGDAVNPLVEALVGIGKISNNLWQNPGDAHVIVVSDPFPGIAPPENKAIVVAGYNLDDTFCAGLKLIEELDELSSYAPVLSGGSVTPDRGYNTDSFRYQVRYTDQDNNPPAAGMPTVSITGGAPQAMTKKNSSDTDYIDGCDYEYVVPAGGFTERGYYNFKFAASDGINNATGDISQHKGPTVKYHTHHEDYPWVEFKHDSQKTGRSPYAGPANNNIRWISTKESFDPYYVSLKPDGTIYLFEYPATLHALNKYSNEQWNYFPCGNSSWPAIGPNGRIHMVANGNKEVMAINSDGSKAWSFSHTGNAYAFAYVHPTIDYDGVIYAAFYDDDTDTGTLYVLNPDGSLKWSFSRGGSAYYHIKPPAIGYDGTVYVAYSDIYVGVSDPDRYSSILYALKPEDGSIKWSYDSDSWYMGYPVVGDDGTIYLGLGNANPKNAEICALNPDGTAKWRYTYAVGQGTPGSITDATMQSPVIEPDGTLYACSYGAAIEGNEKIFAIYPDGTKKWELPMNGWVSAVDNNGTIYVSDVVTGKTLYAINNDSSEKWSYTFAVGERPRNVAIGDDNTCYVSVAGKTMYDPGFLYAFGPSLPNRPPNKPSLGMPYNGETNVSLTPTLTSSNFKDGDYNNTHQASQWQITTTPGDYSSAVWDSGTDTANKTSVNVPSGRLNHSATYYWHVRHQDNNGAWSDYSNEWNFTTNVPPALSNGDVTPNPGYIFTPFKYTVRYTDADNDAPAAGTPTVSINGGTAVAMAKTNSSDNTYTDGCDYEYTLATGNLTKGGSYTFQFAASDGESSATGDINSHSGPTVDNSPPVLSNGDVTPASGTVAASFKYTIKYTDADGDAPASGTPTVSINGGTAVAMSKTNTGDNTYTDGCDYEYTLAAGTLAKGTSHNYKFAASDGTDNATGDINQHSGPTVNNSPPSINSATITGPNPAYETSTLTATASGWSDADGDPAGYTYQWYKNGSSSGMPTTQTCGPPNFAAGDNVFCKITPFDGTDSGTPKDTATVTIYSSTTGAIEGHVYRADGVTPISWAAVSIHDFNTGQPITSISTNDNGYYLRPGINPGSYKVMAYPPYGYAPEWYKESNSGNRATKVDVSASNTTGNIDFTLDPGGEIRGYLYKEDGVTPATDVFVDVSASPSNDREAGFGTNVIDSNGLYKLRVGYGDYKVRIYSPKDYITGYYNNKKNFEEADIVTVSSAQDADNINFTLKPGATITGKVLNSSQQPVSNVTVEYSDEEYDAWRSDVTDTEGRFCLTGLPSGVAELQAQPDVSSGYAFSLPWPADHFYFEAPNDYSDFNIIIKEGAHTKGNVKDVNSNAVGNLDELAAGGKPSEWYGPSGPNGSFEFRMPQGDYKLCLWDNSYTYNALPVDFSVTDTSATVNLPDMIVYNAATGGTISGGINNPSGHNKEGSFFVAAYPAGTVFNLSTAYNLLHNPVGKYESDTAGQFTLTALPPGINYDVYLAVFGELASGLEWVVVRDADKNAALGANNLDLDYTSEGGTITGKIINTDSRGVVGALVLFMDQTDTDLKGFTISGKGGVYSVYNMAAGTYKIHVTHTNYDDVNSPTVTVTDGSTATAPDITLGSVVEDELRAAYIAYETAMESENIAPLMALYGDDYLDDGRTKAMEQGEFQDLFTQMQNIQLDGSIDNITITDDKAIVQTSGRISATVASTGKPFFEYLQHDTHYWVKDDDKLWRLYGNHKNFDAGTETIHLHDGRYDVRFYLESPSINATSVTVNGPGVTNLSLTYYADDYEWRSRIGFGTQRPGVGDVYTFTVQGTGGPYAQTEIVTGIVENFGSQSSPVNGNSTGLTPAFNWTAVPGVFCYQIEVFSGTQANFPEIWSRDIDGSQTSIIFNNDGNASGPLTSGQNYCWRIHAYDENWNSSLTNVAAFQTSTLSVSISPDTWGIGEVSPGSVTTMNPSQKITVTNNGELMSRYSLNVVNPSVWTASTVSAGDEQYLMNAAFSGSLSGITWNNANHAISTTPTAASNTKFAGDERGTEVQAGQSRTLWLQFHAPTETAITSQQNIEVIITAEEE